MSLTLVGDIAQSIYGWRDAKPYLFLNFPNLFKDKVKVFSILKNYRSPQQLVEISNVFRKQFEVHGVKYTPAVPVLPEGENVFEINDYSSPDEEHLAIISEIQRLHKQYDIPYSKFSILCRTNDNLTQFEPTMVSMGIPYYFKFDSLSIMNQSAFRYLYNMYSFIINPHNALVFGDLLMTIKGVGAKMVQKIKEGYRDNRGTDIIRYVQEEFPDFQKKKKPVVATKILDFCKKVLEPLLSTFQYLNVTQGTRKILSLLNNFFSFEDDTEFYQIPCSLKRSQLLEACQTISDLYSTKTKEPNFLSLSLYQQFESVYEALQLTQDNLTGAKWTDKESRDALGLYTIHSYKGMENDYIYYSKTRTIFQIDAGDFENKCVFYVALTRARKKLAISGSAYIKNYDGTPKMTLENPFVVFLKRYIAYGTEDM